MTSLTLADLILKYAASLILNDFLEADLVVPGESPQKQYILEMSKTGMKICISYDNTLDKVSASCSVLKDWINGLR